MNKKTILTAGILLMFGFTGLNAFSNNNKNLKGLADFYYKQGYQAGYKSGYEKGYQDALNYAKQKLQEYALKIKAYEAGKYLIKEDKITYPQVFYIKKPDNSIQIVIKNSQIANEISAGDILYIPKLNLNDYSDIYSTANKNSLTVSNAVSLNQLQINPEVPKISKNTLKVYYLYMPNTQSYKALLNKANVPYAEDGNRLKIIFSSKKNAEEFIKNYGLVKNVDYFTK